MYCQKEMNMKEMSGNFTMALVHEVKNPLSLIKAHIEFLELDKNLSVYKNNIDTIKKEINKISEIVTEFMQSCKKTETAENLNIIPIIKENIKILGECKKNVNFEFELNCSEEYFVVNAEYLKISMLFSNIFKNAVEAIKNKGDIKVALYLKDNRPIIDVIDDGEGLSKNICKNIYKPFVTNKKDGTGLGILICVDILNEIGGEFEIFNNKDKGCTVRLKL